MAQQISPEIQQKIADAAVAVEKYGQCPAEVLYAQCAVESDWLRRAPGNNCFGVKSALGISLRRQLLSTWERFTPQQLAAFLKLGDGRKVLQKVEPDYYRVLDWFSAFESLEECFAWRAARWRRGADLPWVKAFYQSAEVGTKWYDLFYNIAKGGYATATPKSYADACMDRLNAEGSREALAKARTSLPSEIA